MMSVMKKPTVIALVLLLLIPAVLMVGGFLFSLINPEVAAGHANYARNFYLLSRLRVGIFLGSGVVAAILWLLVFFVVIRSKQRSLWWLLSAALGPLGLAILAALNDKVPAETDRYAQFVANLNIFVRIGYEVCRFVAIWLLAYEAMVLKRNLMILYESATTGTSTAQIIATQNASSGMWAFGESLEVMFLVVLFYLLWPIVFNIVARMAAFVASPKPR
jgi:hypothetical protein